MTHGGRRRYGETVRYQEILRRLAIIDEGFVENQAGLGAWPRRGLGPGSQDRGPGAGGGIGGDRVTGGLPGIERYPGTDVERDRRWDRRGAAGHRPSGRA